MKVIEFYENTLNNHPDIDENFNVDVTYDGTWHTHGHKSLLGAGAIVDANTKYYELYKKEEKSTYRGDI